MKAVAVSDVYIKKEYYEECFSSYPEYSLKVVDFGDGTRSGTRAVLDASLLSLMKPTAFFINTARACLVDYGELYTLLKERRIAGAALEVHPTEPTPPGYPFASLDNVTLTTHRGGDTLNAYSDSPAMVMSDYARYLAGKKPRFFVDPEVGYVK